jgi:hypothetical protein
LKYKILINRIPAWPDLYGLNTQEQFTMLPLVVTQGVKKSDNSRPDPLLS